MVSHTWSSVPRVCNVTAVLWLWCLVHSVISHDKCFVHFTFALVKSMCTVPSMAVVCTSLMLSLPSIFFRYFLNVFYMVPVAPIITGITLVLHSAYAKFLL